MPRKPRTLSVEVSAEGFAHLTFAMMVESNKALKLQGFGQCLSRWLAESPEELLEPNHIEAAAPFFDTMSKPDAKVWVALSIHDLQNLKDFRDLVERCVKRPLTLAGAIMTIVELVYIANIENPLA